MRVTTLIVFLFGIAMCSSVLAQATRPTTRPSASPPTQNDLEAAFSKMLTGATLVGRYTVGDSDASPKEERYTISKASKILGDRWVFVARIQFGGKDVLVPIPLIVKWAGDTPVIQVTDLSIPTLGTYTARVMFYRNEYAGTWGAKDHGGHLYGRIEPAKSPTPDTPAK